MNNLVIQVRQDQRVDLVGAEKLIAGSVYDPFTLRFPTGAVVDPSKLTLEIRRSHESRSVVVKVSKFSSVVNAPLDFTGALDLSTDDVLKWVETWAEESDNPNGTCWLTIREDTTVFASCSVLVLLAFYGDEGSGDVDDPGTSPSDEYCTKGELEEAIKAVKKEFLSTDKTGSASFVHGVYLDSKSFKKLDGTVVYEFDYNTIYIDRQTKTLYMVYNGYLQPAGGDKNLALDIFLDPVSTENSVFGEGSAESIKEQGRGGREELYYKYLKEAVLPGYLKTGPDGFSRFYVDDAYTRFYTVDRGVFYLDVPTKHLYLYSDTTKGIVLDITSAMDADHKYVTDVTLSDDPGEKTPEGGYKSSVTRDDNGGIAIQGVLSQAVIAGDAITNNGSVTHFRLADGTLVLPESADPRCFYLDKTSGYTFYPTEDTFRKCSETPLKFNGVTQVRVNGSVKAPDASGAVDIGNFVETAVVQGTLRTDKLFTLSDGSSVDPVQGVFYVDSSSNIGYIWNGGQYVKVIETLGEVNTIENVKLNGDIVLPDKTSKTVDLGQLLRSAFVVGHAKEGGRFEDDFGRQIALDGTKFYIDLDQDTLYVVTNDRLTPVIRLRGDPNTIEAIKVNGSKVPISDKVVDLGTVLSSIFVLGNMSDSGVFYPSGSGVALVTGDVTKIYVDQNSHKIYYWAQIGFQELSRAPVGQVLVNGNYFNPTNNGTIDLGDVVKSITVKGNPAPLNKTNGNVELSVATVAEATLQRVSSVVYSPSEALVTVAPKPAEVEQGVLIYRSNITADAGVKLDLNGYYKAMNTANAAYTFELWIRNAGSAPAVVTLPTEAYYESFITCDIMWLSDSAPVTLSPGKVMYMSVRLAPNFQGVPEPIVHATVYHVEA